MFFKCIFFRKDTFFNLRFWTCYKVVFFKEHVMNHKTKSPNINLWPICLLSENLRWHKNWCTNNFFVNLFFDSKTEVSQFIQNLIAFFFQKYVIRLDISVNYIIFGDEFYATSKLVYDLNTLRFGNCTFFINNLI